MESKTHTSAWKLRDAERFTRLVYSLRGSNPRVLYDVQGAAFVYVGEKCVDCCLYGREVKEVAARDGITLT